MKKILILSLLAFVFAFSPLFSNAEAVKSRESLIASLQAKIIELTTQLNALIAARTQNGSVGSSATSTQSFVFTKDLTIDDSGSDVLALQNFLISKGYLSEKDVASENTIPNNGYFGSKTMLALKNFQRASNISPVTGYFGPKTKAFINSTFSKEKESQRKSQPFTIISPSAGEVLNPNSTYNITWTGSDPGVSSYAVYLIGGKLGSTGSTFLGTAYPRADGTVGTFSWTIPSDIAFASNYQIQFSGKGASGANSGLFTIGSSQNNNLPTISSITPTQGSAGTVVTIYGNNLSTASSVEFYNSSGRINLNLVPTSIGSNSVSFTISNAFAENVPGGTYQVGVVTNVCAGGCDSNRLSFTLNSSQLQPSVKITSPNGGEIISRDSTINVSWQTTNVPSTQKFDVIRLRTYQNGTEINLANNISNDGTENITIPSSVPAGAYTLEIKTYVNGTLVMDSSDSYFKIVDPASPVITDNNPTIIAKFFSGVSKYNLLKKRGENGYTESFDTNLDGQITVSDLQNMKNAFYKYGQNDSGSDAIISSAMKGLIMFGTLSDNSSSNFPELFDLNSDGKISVSDPQALKNAIASLVVLQSQPSITYAEYVNSNTSQMIIHGSNLTAPYQVYIDNALVWSFTSGIPDGSFYFFAPPALTPTVHSIYVKTASGVSNTISFNAKQDLTVSCSANTSGFVIPGATWSAQVSGGQSPYSYTWDVTGGDVTNYVQGDAKSQNLTVNYSIPGPKHANVTVTDSSGKTGYASCSVIALSNATLPAPTISSVTPNSGLGGSKISISGSNFNKYSFVIFINNLGEDYYNVMPDTVSDDGTQISFTVPNFSVSASSSSNTYYIAVSNAGNVPLTNSLVSNRVQFTFGSSSALTANALNSLKGILNQISNTLNSIK